MVWCYFSFCMPWSSLIRGMARTRTSASQEAPSGSTPSTCGPEWQPCGIRRILLSLAYIPISHCPGSICNMQCTPQLLLLTKQCFPQMQHDRAQPLGRMISETTLTTTYGLRAWTLHQREGNAASCKPSVDVFHGDLHAVQPFLSARVFLALQL